jgi:hypothetical protein
LNPSLSVLLPLYNAEHIAEPLILEAVEVLPDLTSRFDVLVIDDGSTDDTTGVATALAAQFPQIRVIRNARRLGPQVTVRTGLMAGAGELILWRNEDSAAGIRGIQRLWRVLPGQDLACGKLMPQPKSKRTGQPVDSTVAGPSLPELYLARREVIEALPWPPPDRGELEREMHIRGLRWTEIPLPAQIAGLGRLPAIDPIFRQLADQSQRVSWMFHENTEVVHPAEEQRAPNFLGKIRKFALGE